MVTKKHDVTIETAIEARPCPSVTARITVTTCVAAGDPWRLVLPSVMEP